MKIIVIDLSLKNKIKEQYGEEAFKHLCIKKPNLSLAAIIKDEIVGFISIKIQKLPYVYQNLKEAYIQILEVCKEHRRQGIATKLITQIEKHAKDLGCYQLRSWSSKDKNEAINLYKKTSFGVHPQTIISEKTHKKVNGYFATKVL